MDWTQIITLLSGGIIGYFIKYYLNKKSESESRLFKDKREHYRTLILCLKSLREGESKHIDLFFFEYTFIWLYAPDNVIRAANKLVERLSLNKRITSEDQIFIGNLLIEIRHDIGFPRTHLTSADYLYLSDDKKD
jgi:hypothetical protein